MAVLEDEVERPKFSWDAGVGDEGRGYRPTPLGVSDRSSVTDSIQPVEEGDDEVERKKKVGRPKA